MTDKNLKIVCITGSVWTYSKDAPRYRLLLDGFVRPRWFTTGHSVSDASFYPISESDFHLAHAQGKILVYMRYASSYLGITKNDFQDAATKAAHGILIVGFPEIIAQIATVLPTARIFAFKQAGTTLSECLNDAYKRNQLTRIDVDALKPGSWNEALEKIKSVIG